MQFKYFTSLPDEHPLKILKRINICELMVRGINRLSPLLGKPSMMTALTSEEYIIAGQNINSVTQF